MNHNTRIIDLTLGDLLAAIQQEISQAPNNAPKKMLWTAKEAVQLTGFSESTIRQVGHENPEVMIKRGRAVRFDPDGLRRALANVQQSKIKRK